MKSFTDLEQSKKLAEILPIESADMRYTPFGDKNLWVWSEDVKLLEKNAVPCWSLAVLYSILPNDEDVSTTLYCDGLDDWYCKHDGRYTKIFGVYADNPIDACYEMIIMLLEKNLGYELNIR